MPNHSGPDFVGQRLPLTILYRDNIATSPTTGRRGIERGAVNGPPIPNLLRNRIQVVLLGSNRGGSNAVEIARKTARSSETEFEVDVQPLDPFWVSE
jgi:hypothetical protein